LTDLLDHPVRLFWGIEFDFDSQEAKRYDFEGKQFALLVQERCFSNGLVIMAFGGCANLEGTKGDHCLLSPAYTVTTEELDKIVDIFVRSVEEILTEHASA
jgi:adenosylmethionine-8-amino-7-oxononanoate aminotransferase